MYWKGGFRKTSRHKFSCFLLLTCMLCGKYPPCTLQGINNISFLRLFVSIYGVPKITNIIGHTEEITEELKTVFIHIVEDFQH